MAAAHYKMLGGKNWVRNVLLTTALFCGPMLVTFSFLNTVAIVYRSTAALPFGTICIIVVMWALITFPLTVLGAIGGKNSKVPLPGCSSFRNIIFLLCGSLLFYFFRFLLCLFYSLFLRSSVRGYIVDASFTLRLFLNRSRCIYF